MLFLLQIQLLLIIKIQNAQAKPSYIARKFESLIDIDAIALAEKQAMRDR